jgi:hypothetical protein
MTNPEPVGMQKRIEEVLTAHRLGMDDWDRFLDRSIKTCRGCTKRFRSEDEHAAHVAALVLALFTKRWTWSWPNGAATGVPGFGYEVDSTEEALEEAGVTNPANANVVSRFVSDWERAE